MNENLKKSLNTKDGKTLETVLMTTFVCFLWQLTRFQRVTFAGRLVAGLITDFLQVFHLDFTLAVFQPEINTVRHCYCLHWYCMV